jgi:hypothetical protein
VKLMGPVRGGADRFDRIDAGAGDDAFDIALRHQEQTFVLEPTTSASIMVPLGSGTLQGCPRQLQSDRFHHQAGHAVMRPAVG